MVKITRSYTIDTKNVENLKRSGVNASDLINELLTEYFDSAGLGLEAINKRVGELEEEISKKQKKIKNLVDQKLRLEFSKENFEGVPVRYS